MKNLLSLFIITVAVFRGYAVTQTVVSDAEQLAQRFRPYYKFSVENGSTQEPCRPCSWEWFVSHSRLFRGDKLIATTDQLLKNPRLILSVPDGNILTSQRPTTPLQIRPNVDGQTGEPWDNVINSGAGLYAQVEDAGNNYVVLTYWTLFAFNRTTVSRDHEGDITALVLVYDRNQNKLVRASYAIHGKVLESFDLEFPISISDAQLVGRRADGATESVIARVSRISDSRKYQNGPYWHSPAIPADLYFVRDPQSGRFEHLAMFCEWGSHEPWPNPHGSVVAAPKHGGEGISFLPHQVRLLGSISNPVPKESPFVLFNGLWGNDPKGLIFHRSCFYSEGRKSNHFKIAETSFVDRDPFGEGTLPWPPPRGTAQVHIHLQASCSGDQNGAQLAMRWGHPNHDQNEYFPKRTIQRGKSVSLEFVCADRLSELELQTEGGKGTGYTISIRFDKGDAVSPQTMPTILLEHSSGHDNDVVNGGVGAKRSSPLNEYGEQNIRIDMVGNTHGPIQ